MSTTQDTEKYNGWTNYETWVCKLWMDNEEESQTYWQAQAKFQATPEGYVANKGRFAGAFDDKPDRLAVNVLAKQLEEQFDEQAEDWMGNQASFFADIFNAGLSRVNWLEIAKSLIEEIDEA